MNPTVTLGGAATFLAGGAVALLASYPIPEHNLYVCFVALFVGLAAALLGAVAIVIHATTVVTTTTKAERVQVDRVVEVTVDQLLRRRGLELVDND